MDNETALAEGGSGAEDYLDECTYIVSHFNEFEILKLKKSIKSLKI